MKKSTTAKFIAVIAIIMAVAGGIMIIYGISQLGSYYSENEGEACLIYGLCVLLTSPVTYGFGIIVDAANRYLEGTEKCEIADAERTNNSLQPTDKRASDEERIANLKALAETGALSREEVEEEIRKIRGK